MGTKSVLDRIGNTPLVELVSEIVVSEIVSVPYRCRCLSVRQAVG